MSSAATVAPRSFELHGVELGVYAEDGAVIDAMELRLRDFASEEAPDPELRLEFVTADAPEAHAPPRAARPVYDTPHGTLHYLPDADLLLGRLGAVELRAEAGRGVARLRSPAFVGRDLYLATHPLATISLMELLERRGRFALHAACLASATGEGVLLAGASGAGKSTLAVALAHSGMRFLSDDIVFLAPRPGSGTDPGEVRVLGFADTVGLTEHAAAHFPELRPATEEPLPDGFPKRLHRSEDLFGVPALSDCEPRALVFPTIAPGAPSRIAALDQGAAMLRLVPDVLLTHPAATHSHLRAIAALLRQVRCYRLSSGRDLERAVALVRAVV
ncbi:MAG: hypothetical protein JO027_18050 [Solirubrobacterales bacterium]|nr:hypothetical protein [Solirubrobacterales bacterium]